MLDMKLRLWFLYIFFGLACGRHEATRASTIRMRRYHPIRHLNRACEPHVGIPRILHYIFLDGEATYWRNATLGEEFTPNYYPRTKDKGDRNATFRHEWKTGCQRLMPEWTVHQPRSHKRGRAQHSAMHVFTNLSLTTKSISCFQARSCASYTLLYMLLPCVQHRFWDMEAAVKLIREQYSWFLPTFESYNSVVAKGDHIILTTMSEQSLAAPK